jgi:hypothetical protein
VALDGAKKLRALAKPSLVLSATCLFIHLIVNNQYGVFRDELYFIVCGQHPAWGYVDQPPLVPLIAGVSHAFFGTALLPLRLAAALAMTATVGLTAEFARILGGGRFAQGLSGLAVLVAPIFLADGLLLTTDFLQALTWLGCSWCLVRLAQTRNERWWIAFGAIVGVSLLSKYLIVFYLIGLAVGVVATPLRRSLFQPWLYVGAAIAFVIVGPNVFWQAQLGWPFIEVGKAAAGWKNTALSPLSFFGQQVQIVGPAVAPVWLASLWSFSFRPAPSQLRVFPIAYAVMVALFLVLHGKAYYIAAIYPTLLAGGAVAVEAWIAKPRLRWTAIGIVGGAGALSMPFVLPILSPDQTVAYSRALGSSPSSYGVERIPQGVLPQHLADMFGWREMAAKVAGVYQALPPAERVKAVFFGRNYGEAAAIDVYGPALHGPPAISGHNNYFLWGPKGHDGSVVIIVGGDRARLSKVFGSIEIAGRIDSRFALPNETNIPIYVLREPREPLSALWPTLKHYE